MNKTYLTKIQYLNSATMHIGAYTDTPNKPFRVYYCGRDTGKRYEKIGNAARYLEKIAEQWDKQRPGTKRTYTTASEIPVTGSSEWNKAIFRNSYLGEAMPNPANYF